MKKREICFIAQFPPPIHGLSKAVQTLYCSKEKCDENFEFQKVNITNNRAFVKNFIKIFRSKADLYYFTISQTRGGNLRDLIILKLLAMQQKKCLIHLHGGYYRQLVDRDISGWQRKANYRALENIAGAVVLSDSLKYIFRAMVPEERIYVVENCVDNQYLLTDTELQDKIRSVEEGKILHILWLSNFIKSKGYPLVLEMVKKEKERVSLGEKKRFHFDFAGAFFDAEEKREFETFLLENGLEEYVTYHGVVQDDEKRSLLKMCSVFILPTKYPKEGQPISILEAMGNGMFIISTNHAGIPDLVTDGINGIVKDDYESAAYLYQLLQSLTVDELKKTAELNRSICMERFSETQYIHKMFDLFRNMTE